MSLRTVDVRKVVALMPLPAVVDMLVKSEALNLAGECRVRISPGRIHATYHASAPTGLSACAVCHRVVLRGVGRWWEQ